MLAITNEEIVCEIRAGRSTKENLWSLYDTNLPLIRKIIRPYIAYECEADLLQEAYFGLWEAARHYESSKNVRFMTYAEYWIKQSVQRYLDKCGSMVRIPSHTRRKITRLRKAASQLGQRQGREPTAAEVADLLGVPVDEAQEIQGYAQPVLSLDAPIRDGNGLTLADTLQADLSIENDAVDKIYSEHSENELWGIVERYTSARENGIIKEIFLHGKTMAQIGREQGVSIDRVRQIKERGLRKLKIGKARRELLEKFDIIEAGLYRGGLNSYKEHNFTSIVEHLAEKRIWAEERYKRHLAEVGEMRGEWRLCAGEQKKNIAR